MTAQQRNDGIGRVGNDEIPLGIEFNNDGMFVMSDAALDEHDPIGTDLCDLFHP